MNDEVFAPPVALPPQPGSIALKIGPFTLSQVVMIVASVGGVFVMAIQSVFPRISLAPIFIFGLFCSSFVAVLVTFPSRLARAVTFLVGAVPFGAAAVVIHSSLPGSFPATVVAILLFVFSAKMVVRGLETMLRWARQQEAFGSAA